MVTVVDALNFPRDLAEADALSDRGESMGEDDERTVSDLLVDQVEFADVILLSKTDLVEAVQADEVESIVRGLNPRARVLRAPMGEVPLAEVLEYESKLKSMTQGKGTFSMSIDHLDICPAHIQDKVIKDSGFQIEADEE